MMIRRILMAAMLLAALQPAHATEGSAWDRLAALRASASASASAPAAQTDVERHAQARTCKAVSSCEEAVRLWCGGYRRADGDNDGIPCENVCSPLSEIEAIKAKIGC